MSRCESVWLFKKRQASDKIAWHGDGFGDEVGGPVDEPAFPLKSYKTPAQGSRGPCGGADAHKRIEDQFIPERKQADEPVGKFDWERA